MGIPQANNLPEAFCDRMTGKQNVKMCKCENVQIKKTTRGILTSAPAT
jgi:hypothetical protein